MSTAKPQGTHHFIITVQKPGPAGAMAVGTWTGHATPPPGTRYDAYQWLRREHDQRYPHLAGGIVLFWSLEPNQL